MKLQTLWAVFLAAASVANAFQIAGKGIAPQVATPVGSSPSAESARIRNPTPIPGAASACHKLIGDRIRAADLAAAAPVFASLDPAMEVGLSPLPGVTRVFHAADLLRLARNYGVPLSGVPAEVCFERTGPSARDAQTPSGPAPLAVIRGERTAVTVLCGGVVLRFEAEAASSGRPGDTVMLLNPENGNRFAARIETQGRVVVNQ